MRVDEEGRDLYASIVRVPLIIVAPGLERSVRKEPVDTSLDLAATVNTEEDPEEQRNIVDEYQGLARLMRQRSDVELARRADSVAQGMHQGAAEPEDDEE